MNGSVVQCLHVKSLRRNATMCHPENVSAGKHTLIWSAAVLETHWALNTAPSWPECARKPLEDEECYQTIRKGHHIQIYSFVLFLFSTLKPFSLRNCKQIVQIIKEMASNKELSMKSWSRNTDILVTPIICFISDRNDNFSKKTLSCFLFFFHIKSLEAF